MNTLRGIFAPISTPFLRDEEVNYAGLIQNIKHYDQSGLDGYLVLGSTGENKSLLSTEKLKVLETILQNKSAGKIVMSGCIFDSVYESVKMAYEMGKLGADYLMILPPAYFKDEMTDDVLYKFYMDIADRSEVPCILYNAPQFAGGVTLSQQLVRRCADHPNIVGIKDSSSGNIESLLFTVDGKLSVLSGNIDDLFSNLTMGGSGGILILANVFPKAVAELYRMLCKADYEKALPLYEAALRANKIISSEGISAYKALMNCFGLCGGFPRRPLLPITEERKQILLRKIEKYLQILGIN